MNENYIDLNALFSAEMPNTSNSDDFFANTIKLTTDEVVDKKLSIIDYVECTGSFGIYTSVKFAEYPEATYNAGKVLTDIILKLKDDVIKKGQAGLRPLLKQQPLRVMLYWAKTKTGKAYVAVKSW